MCDSRPIVISICRLDSLAKNYPNKVDPSAMEHGKSCEKQDCREVNDFLLMKCTFCKKEFCKQHSTPNDGSDQKGHLCQQLPQEARTIICPICKQIVPVRKGATPDLVVNQHISLGCKTPSLEKVFTNQCKMKGCKKKEAMPIRCGICLQNYCLKHRLEVDHACAGFSGRSSKAEKKSGSKDCILQ
jgi:predicted nucleic acid binding AN1-type Zn finger protein